MRRLSIKSADWLRARFWPDFVERAGCVFVAFQISDSTVGPPSGTLTQWELFVNHTHIWDEFRSAACPHPDMTNVPVAEEVPAIYIENHPEFLQAKQIGETMARMWATKLSQDFPADRFRVYYLHYDHACLRFHKVRADEDSWLTDEEFLSADDLAFRDGVVYDTFDLQHPLRRRDSDAAANTPTLIGGLKGKIHVSDDFDAPLPEDYLIM
jgi:hypothetical protein